MQLFMKLTWTANAFISANVTNICLIQPRHIILTDNYLCCNTTNRSAQSCKENASKNIIASKLTKLDQLKCIVASKTVIRSSFANYVNHYAKCEKYFFQKKVTWFVVFKCFYGGRLNCCHFSNPNKFQSSAEFFPW